MADLEKNKELLRRFFKAINDKNLDLFDELCGEDYIWHGESGPTELNEVRGRDNFKKAVAEFTDAMPDLDITLHDLIAEGDKVVVRFEENGTHTGAPFAGIPAAGNKVNWTGIGIYRFANGRIVEEWFSEDSLGILKQIGAL
ncbi:MAG: ester cyclase [Spirochaetota bacterium]|nr:MAG: ester cyclase [Spirochaetota bacterium]